MTATAPSAAPAAEPALSAPLAARVRLPLAAALGLGVLGDLLLRAGTAGLGVALWAACLVGFLLALARREGRTITVGAAALAALALLLAAALAWRDAPTLALIDGLALATTLCALGAAVARGPELPLDEATPGDYLRGAASAIAQLAGGAPRMARAAQRAAAARAADHPLGAGSRAAALVAVRGTVLALPALLVFGALFVSADPAFARVVGQLGRIDVGLGVSHATVAVAGAWVAGGFLYGALLAPAAPRRAEAADTSAPGRLGAAEVCVALALLDTLFLAFVVVQLRWLFGGQAVVATTDVSYAEYARRGFFELVAASALALPLLVGAHAMAAPERARPAVRRLFRGTAATLLALLGVVMLSAADRMRLYQAAYGLTELRFHVSAAMAWLAVVFAWAAATLLRGRVAPFALGTLASAWLAVIALQAVNPAARVAAAAAARAGSGLEVDVAYLATLGADAVPTLASRTLPALAQAGRWPEYCALGHALLRAQEGDAPGGWRRSTAGRAGARRAVAAARARIVADCGPPREAGVAAGTGRR